jgi:hypothetical protein
MAPSMIESPLSKLSDEQIEELGKEFDAIHDEVFAELGDRDRRYIVSMIEMHRRLVVGGRILLFAGPPGVGSAQTSSSLKSGTISRMRQGRDSCTAFGSLMSSLLSIHTMSYGSLTPPLASVNTLAMLECGPAGQAMSVVNENVTPHCYVKMSPPGVVHGDDTRGLWR